MQLMKCQEQAISYESLSWNQAMLGSIRLMTKLLLGVPLTRAIETMAVASQDV